jgi:hypothetical protein
MRLNFYEVKFFVGLECVSPLLMPPILYSFLDMSGFEPRKLQYTLIKKKIIFPHIWGNSEWSSYNVIYEEGLPNI